VVHPPLFEFTFQEFTLFDGEDFKFVFVEVNEFAVIAFVGVGIAVCFIGRVVIRNFNLILKYIHPDYLFFFILFV